jgi:hypothetical protein
LPVFASCFAFFPAFFFFSDGIVLYCANEVKKTFHQLQNGFPELSPHRQTIR